MSTPPPIPSEPIKSQACVNTDGAFVCQALKPPKNSQELGFQCGKNSARRQADQKMRGEYLAVTHTMDWPLSCVWPFRNSLPLLSGEIQGVNTIPSPGEGSSPSLLLSVPEHRLMHHSSPLEESDKYFFQLCHIGASCWTRSFPHLWVRVEAHLPPLFGPLTVIQLLFDFYL